MRHLEEAHLEYDPESGLRFARRTPHQLDRIEQQRDTDQRQKNADQPEDELAAQVARQSRRQLHKQTPTPTRLPGTRRRHQLTNFRSRDRMTNSAGKIRDFAWRETYGIGFPANGFIGRDSKRNIGKMKDIAPMLRC